jgi:hypothetical protein
MSKSPSLALTPAISRTMEPEIPAIEEAADARPRRIRLYVQGAIGRYFFKLSFR